LLAGSFYNESSWDGCKYAPLFTLSTFAHGWIYFALSQIFSWHHSCKDTSRYAKLDDYIPDHCVDRWLAGFCGTRRIGHGNCAHSVRNLLGIVSGFPHWWSPESPVTSPKSSKRKYPSTQIDMNNKLLLLPIAALAAAVAGCNQSSGPGTMDTNAPDTNSTMQNVSDSATNAWQKTKEASSNTWQDVKQGTTNAWQNVKDGTTVAYENTKAKFSDSMNDTYDQKSDFVAKAQSDLDELDQKIQNFSDKTANAADNVKADAQAKLQSLRDQRSTLNQKLTDVKNSTADTWNDTKTAFSNAYDNCKSSLKDAWQWLKDKTS
jgi:hypothetical protein